MASGFGKLLVVAEVVEVEIVVVVAELFYFLAGVVPAAVAVDSFDCTFVVLLGDWRSVAVVGHVAYHAVGFGLVELDLIVMLELVWYSLLVESY